MTGFVNALAILIFTAQLDHFVGGGMVVYAMVAVGIAIIYLLPRVTTVIPSPLVAIVFVGGAAALFKLVVPTVGDMGELPSSLPTLGLPDVPFAWQTLTIIGPVALTLAIIGLLESLMTAQLMDDITDENSDGDRESRGQGIANVATGFLGGMAGCAMIGQSMINLRSGGRTRLSTLTAGIALLVLILVAGSVVSAIPMAALVAVMIVVAISTFQWNSIKPSNLKRSPRSETAVMVVTVAVVEVTNILDTDEVAGSDAGTRVYQVTGELFFASTNELVHSFDYQEETPHVIIDLGNAHIWDSSAVAVLDTVVAKFARHGTHAEIIGLNEASNAIHERLSGHLGSGH
jgi:sulfate permease, SulP family